MVMSEGGIFEPDISEVRHFFAKAQSQAANQVQPYRSTIILKFWNGRFVLIVGLGIQAGHQPPLESISVWIVQPPIVI